MPLSGKQKRHLRALGHHLAVVVQVGANGVTDGVIKAATQALTDHELIKVKIADEREGRAEAIAQLVEGTGAEVAQTLGRTVLLFKKRTKKSKFEGLFKNDIATPGLKLPKKKKGKKPGQEILDPDGAEEDDDEEDDSDEE